MNMHPAVHPLVISGSALKRITEARVASHSVTLRVMGAHLFVGYRDESEFGQLSQDAQVGPHVQLAAHQHHLGTGAELLGLPLPLWKPQNHASIRRSAQVTEEGQGIVDIGNLT